MAISYDKALEIFPGLTVEAHAAWMAADAKADEALAAYEAADAAVVNIKSGATRAERHALMAVRDEAEAAHDAACAARNAASPR